MKHFLFITLLIFSSTSFASSLAAPWDKLEVFGKLNVPYGRLGVTPGISIGADVPIGQTPIDQYLRAGALFQTFFLPGTGAFLDFDALLRPVYPIHVTHGKLEAYVLIPIGFTLSPTYLGTDFGFNFAILPGVRYYINQNLGFFTELGFAHHSLFTSAYFPSVPSMQFAMGVTYHW